MRLLITLLALLLPVSAAAQSPTFQNLTVTGSAQLPVSWSINLAAPPPGHSLPAVKCDGVTDDGPAFNAIWNYAVVTYGAPANGMLVWPPGACMIQTTLNMTNLAPAVSTISVMAYGTKFAGNTTGKPVIDMTGSTYMKWFGGTITGDPANTPVVGFRLGRGCAPTPVTCTQAFGAYANIRDVIVNGYFTLASVYNNAAEQSVFINDYFQNSYPTPTQVAANSSAANGYGYVADGYSLFWSQVPTVMPGATNPGMVSFQSNYYMGFGAAATGTNASVTPGAAMWIGNVQSHRWAGGTYLTTGTGSTVGSPLVRWYFQGGGIGNYGNSFDGVHMENHVNAITTINGATWAANQITFTTAAAHGLNVGDTVYLGGDISPLGYNGGYTALTGTTGTTIVVANTTNPGAYTSGGSVYKTRAAVEFAGPQANPFLPGLKLRTDSCCVSASSILGIDQASSITSMTMYATDFENSNPANGVNVVDVPSKYRMSGRFFWASTTNFNLPYTTTTGGVQGGCVDLNGNYSCMAAPAGFFPVNKIADYTLTAADSGKHFSNAGAPGAITFTLPTAAPGLNYCFSVRFASDLKVLASGTDQIRYGTTQTVNHAIDTASAGANVCIEAPATSPWFTTSAMGAWTVN